jgi:Raf kinase inhibitor-like YbhB/YbcL family protein
MLAALAAVALILTSPSFSPGAPIPKTYTCEGRNVSPALRWTAPPRGTRAFGVTMVDTDAHFTHWLAWGLAPSARGIAAGHHPPHEGTNSFGKRGYDGPCPPAGPAHHYVFRVYALNANVGPPFTGHVLAVARLVGTFGR